MTRSVVVLPAPSGPIRPNISPRWTSKVTSSAATNLVVAAGHALDLDHQSVRGGAHLDAAFPTGAAVWNRASAGMPGLNRPSRLSSPTLTL